MTALGPEPSLEEIRRETATNHEAFIRLRDSFARHEGSYALMKSGLIMGFFRDRRAALLAGHERCLDRLFSIHRVLPHERRCSVGITPLGERRRTWL